MRHKSIDLIESVFKGNKDLSGAKLNLYDAMP